MTTPLDVARSQLGYREGPNNDNKYGLALGLNDVPWCALFVTWCYQQAGQPLPSMQPGMATGYAAVGAGIDWAKKHELWRPSWQCEPGDAVCYGWDGPGSSWERMHTGLVESRDGGKGGTLHTIEGNRGDMVARHTAVVGADTILGAIALSRIQAATPKRAPKPQPANPVHPSHTGPDEEVMVIGFRFKRESADPQYVAIGSARHWINSGTMLAEQGLDRLPLHVVPDDDWHFALPLVGLAPPADRLKGFPA